MAVRAFALALELPAFRALAQPLAARAVLLDLLEEGVLDLGDALPHPHGQENLTPGSITSGSCPACRRRRGSSPRPLTPSPCASSSSSGRGRSPPWRARSAPRGRSSA